MSARDIFTILTGIWVIYDIIDDLRHITQDTKNRKWKIVWYTFWLLIITTGLILYVVMYFPLEIPK